MRLALRVIAMLPLIVTLLACCFVPGPNDHGPPTPPPPAHPLFDALETHLVLGTVYGATPDEQRMGELVHDGLTAYDAVAVQIVPGAPPRTVVLVRLDDDHSEGLADLDDTERRAMLTNVAAMVDVLSPAPTDIVVAIRGNVFYGARYRRSLPTAPEYDVGFTVDAEEWVEAALTPPPPPTVPSVSPPPGAAPPP